MATGTSGAAHSLPQPRLWRQDELRTLPTPTSRLTPTHQPHFLPATPNCSGVFHLPRDSEQAAGTQCAGVGGGVPDRDPAEGPPAASTTPGEGVTQAPAWPKVSPRPHLQASRCSLPQPWATTWLPFPRLGEQAWRESGLEWWRPLPFPIEETGVEEKQLSPGRSESPCQTLPEATSSPGLRHGLAWSSKHTRLLPPAQSHCGSPHLSLTTEPANRLPGTRVLGSCLQDQDLLAGHSQATGRLPRGQPAPLRQSRSKGPPTQGPGQACLEQPARMWLPAPPVEDRAGRQPSDPNPKRTSPP